MIWLGQGNVCHWFSLAWSQGRGTDSCMLAGHLHPPLRLRESRRVERRVTQDHVEAETAVEDVSVSLKKEAVNVHLMNLKILFLPSGYLVKEGVGVDSERDRRRKVVDVTCIGTGSRWLGLRPGEEQWEQESRREK
ncbi:hypothetical protein BTVI_62071 [Pitangus sulphuratus]|nr:hypothetical protein BTVI_62071 [Pitangus sulphuratus]